ncbi:SRPBCC family protein [Micromonospora sp. NPDC049559]|uniref:SRPBCC family protein n=1 Tax=Micromonospora sp. NPDC049559 TaxID=3155923 RepID=UPI003435844C
MSTVTARRSIDASVAEIWRVCTDLPARARWLSTVDAVEALTEGRFDAGTRWRETRSLPDGGVVVEEFEVVEASEPRSFTVVSPGIGVDYRTTYHFDPVAHRFGRGRPRPSRERTTVTVVQEAVSTAPYGRVLALLFGGLAARSAEWALHRELADLTAAVRPVGRGPAVAA